ncbi:MAG TPA: peptidoglycan DD-metalloendopeptidase family protein [Mariniphaga sp.]|nr:peptidoglycan DD-metalloendopeptidase family protein [Mariniphaga sp.]
MKEKKNQPFFLFSLLIIVVIASACGNNKNKNRERIEMDSIASLPTPPLLKYGLPVDSFILEDGQIKPNQNLSGILTGYGVSMATIDRIAKEAKDIFDVRKIRGGKNFTIFMTPDSISETRYFVYENSAIDYYVFELFDSLRVYKGEKEVETKIKSAYGEIESSLWNAITGNGLDPQLALRLSDIFAWSIDFFAIQKGDRFRVIYEEQYVDSVPIGIGEIYAVQFDHYGSENYAFRFYQDDRYDYFDHEGNSLRRAFLKAPLEYARISSGFSHARMHPVLRIRRPHHGVDYAAPTGTPVMTIGDGTVIARAYQRNGGGNYLRIKHNSVYTTVYMHLSGFAKGIAQGTRVKQGQVIGYVGSTGLSTGPHLDFRVFKNGSPVDPLKVEAPPVEPVNKDKMDVYIAMKDSLMLELKKINWDPALLAETENIDEK